MRREGSVTAREGRGWIAICALALLTVAPLAWAQAPAKATAPAPAKTAAPAKTTAAAPAKAAAKPAGTLGRIQSTGTIKIGYRADTRPFSYKDASGNPAGYAVDLCNLVVEAAKRDPRMSNLKKVEWVAVTPENRFAVLQSGQIDLLCGGTTETLERRRDVSFSLPFFPGGIGVMLRSDAPQQLREILSAPATPGEHKGAAGQIIKAQTFAVVTGTTSLDWLVGRLDQFEINAQVANVETYDAGIQRLLDHQADAFFGDRAILMEAAAHSSSKDSLSILDRSFTYERLALAMARGDEDFRLSVDRALSRVYASGEIETVYAKWFGTIDDKARAFFRQNTLPD